MGNVRKRKCGRAYWRRSRWKSVNRLQTSCGTCRRNWPIPLRGYVTIVGGYVDVAAKWELANIPRAPDGSCNHYWQLSSIGAARVLLRLYPALTSANPNVEPTDVQATSQEKVRVNFTWIGQLLKHCVRELHEKPRAVRLAASATRIRETNRLID